MDYLGPALERAVSIYRARLRAVVPDITMTQIVVLDSLKDGGAHSQRDICRATGIDRSTINAMVRHLLSLGYVSVHVDKADLTVKPLRLTPKGRRAYRRGTTAMHSIERVLVPINGTGLAEDLTRAMRAIVGGEPPPKVRRNTSERQDNMRSALEAMEN